MQRTVDSNGYFIETRKIEATTKPAPGVDVSAEKHAKKRIQLIIDAQLRRRMKRAKAFKVSPELIRQLIGGNAKPTLIQARHEKEVRAMNHADFMSYLNSERSKWIDSVLSDNGTIEAMQQFLMAPLSVDAKCDRAGHAELEASLTY